jgi:dUTP pyrophosphatase
MENELLEKYGCYMLLNIYVKYDEELRNKYIETIHFRNEKMNSNSDFIDAGFDLFVPVNINIPENPENNMFKLDHGIKCAAKMVTPTKTYNTGYYLYPRSSISKTSFRLANSVGIIDAGYRGNIIAALDMNSDPCMLDIEPYSRLVQICAPGLVPIVANIVDSEEELGNTERGTGGFGSTGV